MMKEAPDNHLKKKYIASIQKSPILFTAPHSKKLNRGGKEYEEKLRIHKRQIYTSFLASDFAIATGKNSFLFWGVTNIVSETDIDPNYLLKKHFPYHPFHQALHYWALLNNEQPLFHVDIHGKMDRENDCEVDVGIRSMEAHWEGDLLVQKIRAFFAKNGHIFQGYMFKGKPCRFNIDPYLHGYWGGGIHTMTEQAIILGIPSLQLQIPLSVRKKMFRDPQLRSKFHNIIRQLYVQVIVPDFQQSKRKYRVSEQIGKLFVPTINGEKEREEVHNQISRFESKEEASPNQNKII